MEVRALFGRFVWRGINIYDVTIHPSPGSRINPTLKQDSTTGEFRFTGLFLSLRLVNTHCMLHKEVWNHVVFNQTNTWNSWSKTWLGIELDWSQWPIRGSFTWCGVSLSWPQSSMIEYCILYWTTGYFIFLLSLIGVAFFSCPHKRSQGVQRAMAHNFSISSNFVLWEAAYQTKILLLA